VDDRGLRGADAGVIELDGRNRTRGKPYHRNIGIVFQSYTLFPHVTVAGNVGFSRPISFWIRISRRSREFRPALHDLVVDDEADIRAEVRQMLETKSDALLDAGDPHQALRIASQLRVDLLIPDVVSR
jgi:ABC-type Fe3+/spermidine/putrescine transport system ATPase subunit